MSERLRIGVDARILAEATPMGVSRFMAALLRAAAEMAPEHEYLLYLRYSSFGDPSFLQPPFSIRQCGSNRVLANPLYWQQVYLPWRAWRDDVDILFSPYYCGPLFSFTPQVVCISDISFALFPQDFPSWLYFKPKLLARPSSHRAIKVMTISEFSRQELLREYRLSPEKVVVIHAGVEDRFWRRAQVVAQQSSGRQVQPPFFLFVGSLLPRRRIKAVLQALAQLPKQYQLVVVGDNDARRLNALQATARQWNVEQRVQCLGHVSDDELAALYAQALALLSPSIYEGFGLPVLEAMSRGAPVIAWDIPVVREVAADAAVLLPVGSVDKLTEAMRRMGEDPAWRNAVQTAGQERARQFSWTKAAALFLALLHSAAKM